MVNLDLYRVFFAVAKCGSITKAAEELYISQPAVSQAIKQLENQLGGALFNRTHRGIELTETGGKQIFDAVEKALLLFSEAENKFNEIKNGATGIIRICASDTVFTHILIDKIKKYHEKYPNVNLLLINGTSKETIENLKNKKGDLGFVSLPFEDSDIILSNKVMEINNIFVANEKFSNLKGKIVPLKVLQEYPLLMLDMNTSTRQAIIRFAHSIGVHLHPEIQLSSLELMIEMAKNGIGIACVPKEFLNHELNEEKSLFEIETTPKLPSRAIGMVLPKNEPLTFALKELINFFG